MTAETTTFIDPAILEALLSAEKPQVIKEGVTDISIPPSFFPHVPEVPNVFSINGILVYSPFVEPKVGKVFINDQREAVVKKAQLYGIVPEKMFNKKAYIRLLKRHDRAGDYFVIEILRLYPGKAQFQEFRLCTPGEAEQKGLHIVWRNQTLVPGMSLYSYQRRQEKPQISPRRR